MMYRNSPFLSAHDRVSDIQGRIGHDKKEKKEEHKIHGDDPWCGDFDYLFRLP